ncbi:hypothetical protein [Streptomyces spinoverrucosus]|nr:hypothetical protein [Streptomyces spinoverrucosus]
METRIENVAEARIIEQVGVPGVCPEPALTATLLNGNRVER